VLVSLLRVYALGMMYAKWMLKNKLFYLYLTLFMPLTILVPFYLLVSAPYRSYVAVGTIVLTIFSNSLVTASQDIAVDKIMKRIAVIITKPITSTEYFLGLTMSNAIQTFPAVIIAILVLISIGILKIYDVAFLTAGLLAAWYVSTAIGFIIGILLSNRDYHTVVLVGNIVSFILVFLAPIYYPPSNLPEFMRTIALTLPSLHVANLIGRSCNVEYGVEICTSTIYVLALALILTIVIARKIRLKDIY